MSIVLTEDQVGQLEAEGEMPHRVINPRTDETFFLVTEDQFARLSDVLEEEKTLSSLRMMALANALARGE